MTEPEKPDNQPEIRPYRPRAPLEPGDVLIRRRLVDVRPLRESYDNRAEYLREDITRICGSWWRGARCEVADIVQEAYIRAWENRGEFADDGSVEAMRQWLASNLTIEVRRAVRMAVSSRTDWLDEVDESRIEIAPIEERREVYAEVMQERIEALPENLRVTVELHLAGWSMRGIGREMRCDHKTVSVRLRRAQQILGSELPDFDGDDVDMHLFKVLSHVTVYHKPPRPWESWVRNHPRERAFRKPMGGSPQNG